MLPVGTTDNAVYFTFTLEGSRELLMQALSLDPAGGIDDFSELPSLADELVEANREWLPRFNGREKP